MKRPLLWVIDPSMDHPEDEGVEQILENWPGRSRLFHPALRGDGPSAGDGYEADGFVLLGSRASVHDDLEWKDRLSTWIAPLLNGSLAKPLLAICFGHQLVAHLAGSAVGHLTPARDKRVGIEHSRQHGGTLLADDPELRVVVSHREEVKQVPRGYRHVATRPGSPIDGLEHERLPIFAFQFHPEARGDFMRSSGLDPSLIDERVIEDSRRLLGAFRRLVLDRARG